MQTKDPPRVLYIEDHDDTRELVTLVLEQRGFEVTTGATIRTGIALAGSQAFYLFFLWVWGAASVSCWALSRLLRDFEQATPVLFCSAAAYEIDKAQAMNSGAQAYLIKPSQPSELCNLVASLIESHRRYERIAV